jgi:transcription antitermination factor NusA-like protein
MPRPRSSLCFDFEKREDEQMRLPVCNFDIESDMLCPNCQAKLDRGEITGFDIQFSKWLLEKEKQYPSLDGLTLRKAARAGTNLILVVNKNNKEILLGEETLVQELTEEYGEPIIIEGAPKLRRIVHEFIAPANEVGVNSLWSADGAKENIVMLREEDRERIKYSKDELREIISAIMGESVLFEFQDDRRHQSEEIEKLDEFDEKMKEIGERRF